MFQYSIALARNNIFDFVESIRYNLYKTLIIEDPAPLSALDSCELTDCLKLHVLCVFTLIL